MNNDIKEIEDQFTKDLDEPDPTRTYTIAKKTSQKNVTLLMKLVLLSTNYPELLTEYLGTPINTIENTTNDEWSALMIAVRNIYGCASEDSIKMLVENKADINSSGKKRTPMSIAGRIIGSQFREKAVTLLLDLKADINTSDIHGWTLLMRCAAHNELAKAAVNEKVIRLLIDRKADLNAQSKLGTSALMAVTDKMTKGISENILKILLDSHANLELQDTIKNRTVLLRAAAQGEGMNDVISLLIEYGADMNAKDSNDQTALIYASGRFIGVQDKHDINYKLVDLLINYGANLDMADVEGYTAMMNATLSMNTSNDCEKIIKKLIDAGANYNKQQHRGDTLLDILLFNQYDSPLVYYLIEIEAEYNPKITNLKKVNKCLIKMLKEKNKLDTEYLAILNKAPEHHA